MLLIVTISCLSCLSIISIYLLTFSPYRIRNWRGFLLLLFAFTLHSIYIYALPLSQLYLLYFLIFIDVNSFDCLYHSVIIFYCISESFFFFFTVEEARLLDKRPLPKQPPLPDDYDIKFIDNLLNAYEESKDDFRVCFAGWFEGIENSSYDLIYEENILQYLTMATYRVKYWHEMTNKQQHHIKKLYNRFFEKYPEQRSKIKPGYNNNIQMRHPYRDLIKYTHYPLLKYLSFGFTRSITVILLMLMGFRYQIIDNVPFYVRKYSKKTSSSPILLLHGLSLGPSTYIPFIYHLIPLERTIILLDVPHASMRLQTEILSMSNMLASIEQLLLSLDEKKVAIISHSYGTLVHSCIVKQLSHLVSDQS
ncbi:unnamed protein product, partial [Adineta steineri]